METVLKATKVNKFFYEPEEFHVLKDISFEVRRVSFYL
jgi:lipoprotein-releasing system ATP-binding protein